MIKKIIYGLTILLIIGVIFGFSFYKKIYSPVITENTNIYIPSNSSFNDLKKIVSNFIDNPDDFEYVAKLKRFTKPIPGMFTIKKGMNINNLINTLRSTRNQTPVKVTFNNQDSLEKLAGRIAKQLETDSISLLESFTDQNFLKNNDFTKKSALGMYIPNQYEIFWNTSANNFRDKMLKEYNIFWTSERVTKAKKLNLDKDQVITLASIVQKETAQTSERPIVAGLYLNRYQNNWPLQADPTVIFAIKELKGHNTIIKRVLKKDLTINSPYNTYKHVGLPPTLIAMPDISSIDAVLNPKSHNYFYMCASVNKIGFHDFAKTLSQHNINAKKYQNWINSKGIKR